MVNDTHNEITVFLNDGDSLSLDAQSQLQKAVYLDLKRIAANKLASESYDNTLSVTALVHEAFLRLENVHSMTWKSRRHYFGAAAESMRRILIDRARYHMRQRREGQKSAISLDEGLVLNDLKPKDIIQLDDALVDLESYDSELADILKLKYFAGLSADEISELYQASSRTISRRITSGRAWLLSQLQPE